MKPAAFAIATYLFAASAIVQSIQAEPQACQRMVFEGTSFETCLFDSRRAELRLAWTATDGKALRNLPALERALGDDSRRVLFAMNAGMFDDQGSPVGLYVENGVLKRSINTANGTGNFYLKPNGVFWIGPDGGVHIATTDDYAGRDHRPIWATQSGPMLVSNGNLNPQFDFDGPSRYVRNGVGIVDTHTAMFAISDSPVSFGKMARFFRDELHCRDALYFDGAVSSLWLPGAKRMDRGHALGPMIVVLGH